MSDFVPRDLLPDLWEEILRRHWSFLETEENIQKLEERKKLEGCLKEFLCVVRHDRKFFLPETGRVLRRSVRDLSDFTAQNAIVAFETISQYANNLFTKPWRKEYRTLKTYSGCFQHDIQSRLVDAEQLFLAMGYRRVSDDTFVLEGPICPDQVTNVSRDAMAAYVECQIMKHIYAGVTAAGYSCSWKEILQHRETHVGGTTQSIKEMIYRLSEKRMRKEQPVQENTYSNVASLAPAACALHGNSTQAHPGNSCALHPNGISMVGNEAGKYLPPYPAPPSQQPPHLPAGPLMTHSRSLEHYQEPHAHLPHRHSFDQQLQQPQCQLPHVYEAPYDCLDGLSMGSSASYAAVTGAYNAPGNRYPLPYNISSQLNAPYASPADVYASGEHPNMYATLGKSGPTGHSCDFHRHQPAAAAAALAAMQHRQSTYPPDHHLIDFDDRAQLTQHDFGTHDYDPQYAELVRGQVQRGNTAARYATYGGYDLPTTLPQAPPPTAQDMYIYARPVPKSSRMRALAEAGGSNPTDKHPRSADKQNPMDNNRKMHKELKERASRTAPAKRSGNERDIPTTISDMTSYESASLDDFVTLDNPSPPLMPKVKEGVGSFESWNYVFKNLERSGYNKDLGDREDLLVQSLDLDSLAITNGGGGTAPPTEKRREPSKSTTRAGGEPNGHERSRTLEKKPSSSRRVEAKVVQAPAPSPLPNSSSAGVKKVKSALKTANVDGNRGTSGTRNRTGAVPKQPPAVSPQLIVTSPNEWSCRFCTFLNPDTKRICEMCCRSKDFNLEAATAASSSAAAAAAAAASASVSHASSTCV
ncbi:hypothetical protein KR059_009183 [Drosophila kikkawai]|nr:hypothetical protein KR059_009183 [Drosophila kikkawai]